MGKSINEEIKQPNFRNIQQKLAVNLLYTTHWLNSKYADIFKRFDLTPQQYNVLRILRGQHGKPCQLSVIRERMIDKTCDLSRIVERMRKTGLIQRIICPEDRRAVNISITPKSLEILEKMDRHNHELDAILKNLSTDEAEHLSELLDKLRT